MLNDLRAAPASCTSQKADVVVIGAGLAGLLLAVLLARKGVRVVVVESGAAEGAVTDDDPLNIVEQRGQPYRGAMEGRLRGFGGTSRMWGGAMLPFLPCDMGAHTAGWPVEWPVAYSELEPAFAQIERTFSLPEGSYLHETEQAVPQDASFILRSAKWPKFKLRNITNALGKESVWRLVDVWLNATVTAFQLAESGRVRRVTARSMGGKTLEVEASDVVVAAGAIESTRLLMLLDARHDNRIFAPDKQLGRYFYDHLSTAAATIDPINASRFNLTFGLKFARGGMRDLRIEPSAAIRRAAGLPAAFAHIAAVADEHSGFAALRGLYRDLQSGSGIKWNHAWQLAGHLPWLAQAGWWRFGRRRLLYPKNAYFELALVIEQMPNPQSTIGLSRTEFDNFGVPRAVIDWRTSRADLDAFAALQGHLCRYWSNSPFAALGRLTPTARDRWESRLQSDSDVFHPGGSTRMGVSPASGVVDGNLRSFRIPNLRVVSTSCFPTGGGANPTFMLLAFAVRAAEQLATEYSGGT